MKVETDPWRSAWAHKKPGSKVYPGKNDLMCGLLVRLGFVVLGFLFCGGFITLGNVPVFYLGFLHGGSGFLYIGGFTLLFLVAEVSKACCNATKSSPGLSASSTLPPP
ncbi:MAG: hypothetical protein Ct9H300mP7_7100 [Verrucomicrobiota bacterium]|nr:MAG: hypothetical protein Ct9H300mP7_7100 [Verrucomicrobiota bacterium]